MEYQDYTLKISKRPSDKMWAKFGEWEANCTNSDFIAISGVGTPERKAYQLDVMFTRPFYYRRLKRYLKKCKVRVLKETRNQDSNL